MNLNLNPLDAIDLDELGGYQEVSVSDTGGVKVRRKPNGPWQSGMMGLGNMTAERIARSHPPGVYRVELPTKEERQQQAAAAADQASEAAQAAIPNPWKKGSFNLTEQLLLSDQNPELAARFKREANAK